MSDFFSTQMSRLRESKQVRYGGYALLTSLGMVAALVLVNLLVDQFGVEADLTQNRLFTLSDQTFQLLDNLDADVTVYQIGTTGRENPLIDSVLERYARRSSHVKLANLDPERNPGLAAKYEEEGQVRPGGLIVDGGDRFRMISQFDIFNVNMQTRQATSLSLEQELTAALLYVTTGDLPSVYLLEGHGEQSMFQLGMPGLNVRDLLENDNYEVDTLDLVSRDSIPEDVDVLLVVAPEQDMTPAEADRLDGWMRDGGRVVFVLQGARRTEMPNLEELLAGFGVRLVNGIIVEESGRHTPDSQVFLVPEMTSHEIVSPMRSERLFIVMPAAGPIEELETKRRTLTVEPFLNTSEGSFLRTDFQIQSVEQQEGEPNGPFAVGVAITDNDLDGYVKSRVVVFSSVLFLRQPYQANYDMLLNSLSWARSREESISIRAKSLRTFPLRMTRLAQLIISGVAVLLVPLGVLGAGLAVWLRRRHL
ncbi:MAG: GldG family protein [Spirochaetaceae bacterium]|nr:GldG family protein [Spirochaetaceae bacterium]